MSEQLKPVDYSSEATRFEVRSRIAELIFKYAHPPGKSRVDVLEEIRKIPDVSLTTVRSWLVYKSTSPDIFSLLQIISYYSIPATEVIEALCLLLPSLTEDGDYNNVNGSIIPSEYLKYYLSDPRSIYHFQQNGNKLSPHINHQEIAYIDVSVTLLQSEGFYLLDFKGERSMWFITIDHRRSVAFLECTNPLFSSLKTEQKLVDSRFEDASIKILGLARAFVKRI